VSVRQFIQEKKIVNEIEFFKLGEVWIMKWRISLVLVQKTIYFLCQIKFNFCLTA